MQSGKERASSPKAILESLAKITEEGETQTLVRSLVATVLEMTNVDFIAVLKVSLERIGGEVTLEAYAERHPQSSDQPVAEVYHDIIEHCIGGRVTETKWHGGKYVITAPILDQASGVVEYITLAVSDEPNPNDDILIPGFTKILQNFVRIMKEGERDGLTSLLNRKRFQDRLYAIICKQRAALEHSAGVANRRQPKLDENYWLALIDIDHFKKINDEFGHVFGDEVILMVARTLRAKFRDDDLLFRYGGEEFVVVIGPCDEQLAVKIFDRFRLAVAGNQFGRAKTVTVSIGIAKVSLNDIPVTIVGNADKALYFAKEHGRNQIAVYEQLVEAGEVKPPGIDDAAELF